MLLSGIRAMPAVLRLLLRLNIPIIHLLYFKLENDLCRLLYVGMAFNKENIFLDL